MAQEKGKFFCQGEIITRITVSKRKTNPLFCQPAISKRDYTNMYENVFRLSFQSLKEKRNALH